MVAINSAESNRAEIRSIAEVVWGTTPASGVSRAMRVTNPNITASKTTKTSEELRADRMVSNIVEVGAGSGGPISYEFSAGSSDPYLEAFLLGTWTKSMNFFLVKGTSVTITGANTITLTGADWRPWLADNQWLKLEGFTTVGNNTYVSINGAPSFSGGNTVITTDQTLTVEGGSAYTKVTDANDVHAFATTINFTSGNTVDGGGANAFGDIEVGQKVWIDGLGRETGTITAVATDPTEGDTFTISDGVQSVTFEIRTNAALVAAGRVHVAFSATENTLAASINAAINDQWRKENLRCKATVSSAVVTVTNLRRTGGSITENSTGLTRVDFSGGSATKGGFYTVASVIDNDTFTVSETLSTDTNSGSLPVVVKGSHVRNPGNVADIVKRSFSFETGYTDVSKYMLVNGLRVGGFSMEVEAEEIVKGEIEVLGRATVTGDSSTLGNTANYTVQESTATEVFNATANVGTIYVDGAALSTAVMGITIEGDANLREQLAVGEKFPAGIGYGRMTLTGTINAYFQDFTLYNKFINHNTVGVAFDVEDVDHNAYWFTIPAVKFTSDPISPGGIDQDVMEELEYEAQRHPTLKTMFMVDRFSSIMPAN